MSDEVVMYRGKRLEDMNREELIGAIHELARSLQYYRTPKYSEAFVTGQIALMKRGER